MSTIISTSALLPVIKAEKNNKGAEFTVKSLKTGKDFTYSISRAEFKGKWYTHIRVEKGYRVFVRLGTYFNGTITNKGSKVTTPSALAIAHVLKYVELGMSEKLDEVVELRHVGKCLRCNRELSDPISIDRGLGPVCISF
jgi:hypothetical protein